MKKIINLFEIVLFLFFLVLIPFFQNKLSILLAIPILFLLYFLSNKIKVKNFAIILFIISFIIRIIFVLYLKVDIVSDFKTMLSASRLLITGNLSFTKDAYFMLFPYQIGHVIYQALLLKIINKVLFLKIINSLVTSTIVLFIYLITKELFKEKTARFISICYLLYFYPLYLNSVLTNQHIPALISLIVIYLLLKKENNIKHSILIACLLSISNVLRTESIIFIAGISIYNLINIKKNNYKKVLSYTSIMIIVYFLTNALISTLLFVSPINSNLKNNAPLWKFYCGLSYKYNGIYNEEDEKVFFNTSNQKELLLNRVKEENIKLPVLFMKKEVILWTQTNYDLRIRNNINNLVLLFNQGYLNAIILIFIISLFPYKSLKNKKILLLKIIISLYIFIYALIEISPRYAYILHILLFLLLGIGINKIENRKGLGKEK